MGLEPGLALKSMCWGWVLSWSQSRRVESPEQKAGGQERNVSEIVVTNPESCIPGAPGHIVVLRAPLVLLALELLGSVGLAVELVEPDVVLTGRLLESVVLAMEFLRSVVTLACAAWLVNGGLLKPLELVVD